MVEEKKEEHCECSQCSDYDPEVKEETDSDSLTDLINQRDPWEIDSTLSKNTFEEQAEHAQQIDAYLKKATIKNAEKSRKLSPGFFERHKNVVAKHPILQTHNLGARKKLSPSISRDTANIIMAKQAIANVNSDSTPPMPIETGTIGAFKYVKNVGTTNIYLDNEKLPMLKIKNADAHDSDEGPINHMSQRKKRRLMEETIIRDNKIISGDCVSKYEKQQYEKAKDEKRKFARSYRQMKKGAITDQLQVFNDSQKGALFCFGKKQEREMADFNTSQRLEKRQFYKILYCEPFYEKTVLEKMGVFEDSEEETEEDDL